MSKQRAALAALLILVALLVTGCWSRREPGDQAYALLLAFDADERGMYEVTAQFANPLATAGEAGGGSGGGQKSPFWNVDARGLTPYEALRNLARVNNRITALSHVQVLLLSERLARRGVEEVFDLIERDPQLRLTIRPAVAEGDMKKILEVEFPLETAPAVALARSLRFSELDRAFSASATLREMLVVVARPGDEMATLPRVRLSENQEMKDKKGAEEEQSKVGMKTRVEVAGVAAFDDFKMVGWLDERATRGLNWIRDTGSSGPVVVEAPLAGGRMTIDILDIKTDIEPQIRGEAVSMLLMADVHGRPHEAPPGLDFKNPAVVPSLKNRFATVIKNDMEVAIARAKELGTDVFGFGNTVYRKDPRLWRRIEGQWDAMFRELPVAIEVKAVVHRPGLVTNATKTR